MLNVNIKLHHHLAQIPAHSKPGDAGYNLIAAIEQPKMIWPGDVVAIPSGVSIHIGHPDYVGLVFPRSGLGGKEGIVLANLTGVIDSAYTGEIINYIWNRGDMVKTIEPGDQICQIVFMPIVSPDFTEVKEHAQTERGAGGFGHTGR